MRSASGSPATPGSEPCCGSRASARGRSGSGPDAMPLFEPAAVKTVKAWFAAHSRGDLEAGRALFAPDGTLTVTSPDPGASGGAVGFDGFIDWYANRSSRVAQF